MAAQLKLQTTFTTVELANREAAARQAYEITHDQSNGVVLLGTEMAEEDYVLFRDSLAPLVVVDGWSDRLFFESVVTQNENSAFRAVTYLAEHGHREIGYIAGDYRIKNFRSASGATAAPCARRAYPSTRNGASRSAPRSTAPTTP